MSSLDEVNRVTQEYLAKQAKKRIDQGKGRFYDYLIVGIEKTHG